MYKLFILLHKELEITPTMMNLSGQQILYTKVKEVNRLANKCSDNYHKHWYYIYIYIYIHTSHGVSTIKPLHHLVFLKLGQIVDGKNVLKMTWNLLELMH